MKMQFNPSILKSVTLPFTVFVLILYLGSELHFRINCGCALTDYLERTKQFETLFGMLGEIWLCQFFFIPLVYFSRYTISDDSITGYGSWLKEITIRFSDIKDVRAGFLGLTIKVTDNSGSSLKLLSYPMTRPEHSWVRARLGLGGCT